MPPERLNPIMNTSEYEAYKLQDKEMFIVADFSAQGKDWAPLVFRPNGKIYRFVCNEPMEDWMTPDFAGHAKYTEIIAK